MVVDCERWLTIRMWRDGTKVYQQMPNGTMYMWETPDEPTARKLLIDVYQATEETVDSLRAKMEANLNELPTKAFNSIQFK